MNTWGEAMQSIGALREEVRFLRKGVDDLMAEKALLEDRVSEIEARVPAIENKTRGPSPTDDGRIVVSANEWERLMRVDNEAREFMRWLGSDAIRGLTRESSIMTGLREALKR